MWGIKMSGDPDGHLTNISGFKNWWWHGPCIPISMNKCTTTSINHWKVNITNTSKYSGSIISAILRADGSTPIFTYNNQIYCLHITSTKSPSIYILKDNTTINSASWLLAVDYTGVLRNGGDYPVPGPIIDTCRAWHEAKFDIPLHDFLYKTLGDFGE